MFTFIDTSQEIRDYNTSLRYMKEMYENYGEKDKYYKNFVVLKMLQTYICLTQLDKEYIECKKLLIEPLDDELKPYYRFIELCYAIKTNDYDAIPDPQEAYDFLIKYIRNNSSQTIFTLERLTLNWTNEMILKYTELETRHFRPIRQKKFKPVPFTGGKYINIAYVSRDFWNRPTGQLMNQLLKYAKKKKEEEYILVHHLIQVGEDRDDDINKNLKEFANTYTKVQLLQGVPEIMQKLNISILIDATGLMVNNNLNIISQKLVPIQISWLAYPG